MAAINSEIGIRRQHYRIRQYFAHANQTGIGQAHWNVGIFHAQAEYFEKIFGEIQPQCEISVAQKLVE